MTTLKTGDYCAYYQRKAGSFTERELVGYGTITHINSDTFDIVLDRDAYGCELTQRRCCWGFHTQFTIEQELKSIQS